MSSECPDYDPISAFGGPCNTCRGDNNHCPLFMVDRWHEHVGCPYGYVVVQDGVWFCNKCGQSGVEAKSDIPSDPA